MRTTRSSLQHLIRTIINPVKHTPTDSLKSLSFTPRSLILLSNSRNIQKATQDILELSNASQALSRVLDIIKLSNSNQSLSLVLASVDSVYQDYTSEIWLSKPLTFQDALTLDENGDKFQQHKTQLTFDFHKDQIKLPLVRTDPFTDFPYTLCFKLQDGSFSPILSELSISLPLIPSEVKSKTSLEVIHQDWFRITSHLDNMIKTINGKPASEILLSKLKDANLGKTQESVFLELRSKGVSINKYEVIAGGGEYGAKSEMLVLNCDKLPQAENLEGRFLCSIGNVDNQNPKGLIIEQVSDDSRIVLKDKDILLDNHLRIGNEAGFEYNEVNFKARDDQVELQFKE
ncbi:Kleisin, abnormal closure, protein 2 [Wickerhamomyces ciferrii]|uniref:Kleisin, abnormal closure, protein 2 n=1 Tax=Wickerhamomyces ciferrii (strain ATCC 14091 / BCRC 22168 / CBS 111 / JCM 3599 / NBRC 0793 / NRRL Y-1031 F-60-10) TaxID=1206466 RepID=K0KXT4_WICCF|nr:Kleisin, abnormal closure, protein 2 [Wickerhamomyces ciferrii]CCH45883.1 Kleisin, abnormal closure, protein 2 [Wickerhamomyces ciferrii]